MREALARRHFRRATLLVAEHAAAAPPRSGRTRWATFPCTSTRPGPGSPDRLPTSGVEYPPYALFAFAPAALVSSTLRELQVAFGLELLAVDVAIRAALLWAARARRGWWAYAPFLSYAVVAQLQAFWLYKRFDLLPGGLTLATVLLPVRRCHRARGRRPRRGDRHEGLPGGARAAGARPRAPQRRAAAVPRRAGLAAASARGARPRLAAAAGGRLPLRASGSRWSHSGRRCSGSSGSWSGVSGSTPSASYEVQGGLAPAVLRRRRRGLGAGDEHSPLLLSLRPVDGPGPGPSQSARSFRCSRWSPSGRWPARRTRCGSPPWRRSSSSRPGGVLAVSPLAAAVLTRVTYPAPGYQTGLSTALTSVLVLRNLLLVAGLCALVLAAVRPRPSGSKRHPDRP